MWNMQQYVAITYKITYMMSSQHFLQYLGWTLIHSDTNSFSWHFLRNSWRYPGICKNRVTKNFVCTILYNKAWERINQHANIIQQKNKSEKLDFQFLWIRHFQRNWNTQFPIILMRIYIIIFESIIARKIRKK